MKRFTLKHLLLIPLFILATLTAQADQILNVTGASFPDSGTATEANTGLATVRQSASWGYWEFVEVTGGDVPPDAVTNGSGKYMILRGNHDGTKSLHLNLVEKVSSDGARATALATGGIYEYFWLRVSLNSELETADHRDNLIILNCGTSGASTLTLQGIIMRAADYADDDWAADDGLGWVIQLNATRPAGTSTIGFQQTFVNPTTTNYAIPLQRFGEWIKIGIAHVQHATEGRMSVYINDTLVLEAGTWDSTSETIDTTWYDTDWTFPHHERLTYEIAGPFTAYNATGGPPELNPRHDLVPDNSSITQAHPHLDWLLAAGDQEGTFWSYTQTTGAPVFSIDNYGTSGNRPFAQRVTVTGDDGDVATVKTRDDIGTLPFRTLDGWATIAFQDILFQATSNVAGALRNAADDGDLATFAIDASGNLSVNGTDTGIDLTANTHYHLALQLHEDGGCRVAVIDLSNNDLDTPYTASAICEDWTPGAAGPFVYTVTYTSGASGVAHQFGNMLVCETWEAPAYDSLVEVDTFGLSPVYSVGAHVSDSFMYTRENNFVPGGRWCRHAEWTAAGYGRRGFACTLGRSGQSQARFLRHALPGLIHMRGARLSIVDGGSVNDVAGFASITDAATAASYAELMNADTDAILRQWVTAQGNEVWIETMHDRTELDGWDIYMTAFVDARNAGLLSLAKQWQTEQRVQFSDTTAVVFDSTDDVHPTGIENYEEAVAMIGNITTPAPSVSLGQSDIDTIADAVWKQILDDMDTAGSVGKRIGDNLDATVSSRSTFDDTTDTVDVGRISGDSGAANSLEALLDGTGAPVKISTNQVGGAALTIENALAGGHGILINHAGAGGVGLTISADGAGGVAVGLDDDSDVGVGGSSDLTGLSDAAAAGILDAPGNKIVTDGNGNVRQADVDGIADSKFRQLLLAYVASSKTTVTDNGDGTYTYTIYQRDGVTPLLEVIHNNSGEWSDSTIDP